MRVYYGGGCALWQPNNTAGCHWNATAQAFAGGGCVLANVTRCATLHLTGSIPL